MQVFNTEPREVDIKGKRLKCAVCAHRQFWKRETQFDTALATFFNLDWTKKAATCYVCQQCGHMHWFLKP